MAAHICIFFNRQVVVEVPEAIHDEMMLEVNKSKLRLGLHKAFMNALTTVRDGRATSCAVSSGARGFCSGTGPRT